MIAEGKLEFVSARTGINKTGKSYNILKFLDDVSEEFVTMFVDSEVFESAQDIQKGTNVLVEFEMTVGKTFAKLLKISEI